MKLNPLRALMACSTVAIYAAIDDVPAPPAPAALAPVRADVRGHARDPYATSPSASAAAVDDPAVMALRLMFDAADDDAGPFRASVTGGSAAAGLSPPPGYLDASDAAAETAFAQAMAGSEEALAVLLTIGPGSRAYGERATEALLAHAARGSVFALQTLAEWSASGFGTAVPDHASAVAFEYLAWLTHRWGGDDFVPSIDGAASAAECSAGIALARALVARAAVKGPFDVARAGVHDCLTGTRPAFVAN